MKILSIITLSALLLIGCSKSVIPTAAFSYTGTKIAPAAITFINNSTNATSYTWAFGDGGTSTESAPAHTYTAAGSYTVTLTAKNGDEVNTSSQTIVIDAKAVVNYNACTINQMYITSIDWTTGSGAGWDIGDGPDLYIEIVNNNNSALLTSSKGSRISNATTSSLPAGWNAGVNVTDANVGYTVYVYDYDAVGNELIASRVLKFADAKSVGGVEYPKDVSFTLAGNTKVQFNLTWY